MRTKQDLRGKVVLVTGASAGIGEALVHQAAARGAAVVLAARRLDRLERIARGIGADRALAVACDVTVDGQVETAVARARERFGRLDIAVANAGFAVSGTVMRLELQDFRRQMELNFFGALRTVRACVPALAETGGALALVGSANGYLSVPAASAYCASKHALRSLAVCLRHELAEQGVSVTHLAPGFITTELRQVDNLGQLHPEATDPVPRWLQMPADRAAARMLQAIVRRRSEQIITFHSALAIFLARHTPWLVTAALRASRTMTRRLGSKPPPQRSPAA